ncbi:MAG: RdgB/HAM1 family non-canonical purine NTP pyrophosphatase [Flavobacteriales bacterium]|nr:MAG: RdgB/HAM1 family non-canonical purine NTP pyrophosphatase [Flavobacteriales bacterium]
MELIVCTNNAGKLAELRALLPGTFTLLTLPEAGIMEEVPETGLTLEANALQKARYVHERTGVACVADDTGLEVDALDGAPGVFSARYAGPARDAIANMHKLLKELGERTDRGARFRTCIAYIGIGGAERTFEGEVRGTITTEPRGTGGFGYDPVFLPHMSDLTFAELPIEKKNAISHRAQAVWRLAQALSESP